MNTYQPARRRLLAHAGAALSALGVAVVNTKIKQALAAGAVSKSEFHYQESLKEGQRCADCKAFIPMSTALDAEGRCTMLRDVVKPSAWCMAFSKK